MSRSRIKKLRNSDLVATWLCIVRSGQMKSWKKSYNRKIRRKTRMLIKDGDENLPQSPKDITSGDMWFSPADGKCIYKAENWKDLRK